MTISVNTIHYDIHPYFFVYCPAKIDLIHSKTLPIRSVNHRLWREAFSFYLSQVTQHLTDIGIEQNGLLFKTSRCDGLPQIDAGVSGLGILGRHAQKRYFDDAGGIAAHAELQKQNAAVPVPAQEVLVSMSCGIPARILYESIICAQVHGHGPAAPGTARDQLRGDPHIRLLGDHLSDGILVVIGFLTAGLAALPKAIVALGVKQPRLVKARQLELMVHIGGQDKVIPAPDQFQQIRIGLAGRHIVTVIVDVAAPPGPVFLQRGEGIESAGVNIPDAVLLVKVGEVFQKALAAVGQAGGGGKAGACADQNGVDILQFSFQPFHFL